MGDSLSFLDNLLIVFYSSEWAILHALSTFLSEVSFLQDIRRLEANLRLGLSCTRKPKWLTKLERRLNSIVLKPSGATARGRLEQNKAKEERKKEKTWRRVFAVATPRNSFQCFLPERATKNVYYFVGNIRYMRWPIRTDADNQISQSGYIAKNAAGTKRGKTPESTSQLSQVILLLHVIGWELNWRDIFQLITKLSNTKSKQSQNHFRLSIETAPSCPLMPSSTTVSLETRLPFLLFVRNHSMHGNLKVPLIYSCFCFCLFCLFFSFLFYRYTLVWRAGCGLRECMRSLSRQ